MDLPLIPYNRKLSMEKKKNIHEFHGFRTTRERFLHEIWACHTHLPPSMLGIISMHDRGENVLVFGFPGDQGTI